MSAADAVVAGAAAVGYGLCGASGRQEERRSVKLEGQQTRLSVILRNMMARTLAERWIARAHRCMGKSREATLYTF
jgi:hypothetical protein